MTMTPHQRAVRRRLIAAALLLGAVVGAGAMVGALDATNRVCWTACVDVGDVPTYLESESHD